MLYSPVARLTRTEFRVRYSDVDSMGVAHHSAHVLWFENGRTDFCRESGFSYADMEAEGVGLAVVDLHCRYRAPARFEDKLCTATRLLDLREKRLRFSYRIERIKDSTLLAEGETLHVCITREGETAPIPKRFYTFLLSAL